MTERKRGIAEMMAAMTISGSIGWFVIASGQPVIAVVFWRCVFGAVALLLLCLAMGVLRIRLTWRQFALAVFGGIAIVINWLLLFGAYSRASISIATAVYNMQPFMLLGFGALLFGERITITKTAWLALAFAGVVLIVMTQPNANYLGSDYPLGIVMALSAALGWAVAALTTKKLKGVPPQLIALIHVATGILMLLPLALSFTLPALPSSWALLGTMGLVHTGVMYALMYSAVQKLPTHLQGALSFIYPGVTILFDVFALGHHLQVLQLAGIAAILLAAAGMTLGWPVALKPLKNSA